MPEDLEKFAALVELQRDTLLARWRKQVRQLPSAKLLDVPTLNDHLPGLLDDLVKALRSKSDQTIPEALREGSTPMHGLQRLLDGFDVEEVVAEYNILRGCLHDLADDNGLNLLGRPFHILNRVLDGAIGLALQTYSTQKALELQHRREEYLAFVAHDLRTPLHAISMAGRVLELTPAEKSTPARRAQMWNAFRRNVQNLEGLVAKILEENVNLQTEAGMKLELREFDLWPLVEELVHDLHPVAGTSSTLVINEVPDDLIVYADAGLLRRLFQNLIANAIKYTPRGEIRIGALHRVADGDVECWVADDGEGIPAEFLEKIFGKGESDPGNEGGLGLGLVIVKTVAEAHGGRVTVESKIGVGSTFRFSLRSKPHAGAPPVS